MFTYTTKCLSSQLARADNDDNRNESPLRSNPPFPAEPRAASLLVNTECVEFERIIRTGRHRDPVHVGLLMTSANDENIRLKLMLILCSSHSLAGTECGT